MVLYLSMQKRVHKFPTFECGVCGAWTSSGDFLSMGQRNSLGQRELLNFVCRRCQAEERRELPPRPRPFSFSDGETGYRPARDLSRMYAAA